VRRDALPAFYRDAREAGIGGGENGLVSDIIACPGLDYCNLANARSLPLADEVAAIGRIIGPSFAEDDVPAVIETIIDTYLADRETDEGFAAYIARSGTDALTGAVFQDRAPAQRAL
jgi:sulfite reductase beta subunit-like hemoprotein